MKHRVLRADAYTDSQKAVARAGCVFVSVFDEWLYYMAR